MKKYLFIGIPILSLIGCNKLIDDTPQCDDPNIIETVKEMNKVENFFSMDLHNEVFEVYSGKKMSELVFLPEDEKANVNKLYHEINTYLKQFIFDKNEDGIPEDILLVIKKVIVNHDVPTSLYDTPAVSNIRIISVNKEAKSCSCQADLNYNENNRTTKPIIFNAQKNTDGEVNVEVLLQDLY